MMKKQNGRILLDNITLIEYENIDEDNNTCFVQCGVTGFYLNQQEIKALYAVLGYYLNIDLMNDIVLSVDNIGENDVQY